VRPPVRPPTVSVTPPVTAPAVLVTNTYAARGYSPRTAIRHCDSPVNNR
jgi:hypothetical protein